MIHYLLWQPRRDESPAGDAELATVAERFCALYADLFATPPAVRTRRVTGASLVYFEVPVDGWVAFEEESEGAWAFAPDYPLNARTVLRDRGIEFTDESVLLSLGRALERDPEPILRELAPPFSLVWLDAEGRVRWQTDGLGMSQAFAHDGDAGARGVITNRLLSLKALGLPLEPVADEWAVRSVLEWFPIDMTGYRGVRYPAPGSGRVYGRESIADKAYPVLREWVHPPEMKPDECQELARDAMVRLVREANEIWTEPTVGLSGGWDSRAVTSVLRAEGSPFTARVRGNPARLDVILSNRLAEIAGFKLRIKTSSGLPPDSAEGCREAIERGLRWQGGYLTLRKHKTFLVRKPHLSGGTVNVTGQHAGIVKSDFVNRIDALNHPPEEYEDRLVEAILLDAAPYMRESMRERVAETVRESYRTAARYDLHGLDALHFFFLYEYTRRWGAATLGGQTSLAFAPFLTPDMIRAAYAYPAARLPERPMHRFITDSLAPDWRDVPYEGQVTEEEVAAGLYPPVTVMKRKRKEFEESSARWRRHSRHRKYHYKFYWKDVGLPLIQEALDQGGFWTDVFDPTGVDDEGWRWRSRPDAVVILHLLPGVLGR